MDQNMDLLFNKHFH